MECPELKQEWMVVGEDGCDNIPSKPKSKHEIECPECHLRLTFLQRGKPLPPPLLQYLIPLVHSNPEERPYDGYWRYLQEFDQWVDVDIYNNKLCKN
jgi:hypothetical protein